MKKLSSMFLVLMMLSSMVGCSCSNKAIEEPPVVQPPVVSTPEPTPEPVVEEPVPESISVSVVDVEREIGTFLNRKDVTVTITMSDGSEKIVTDWKGNTLLLSEEENIITITYEGLSTEVTVMAIVPEPEEPEPTPEPTPDPTPATTPEPTPEPVAPQPEPTQEPAPQPEVQHPYPESAYQPISQQAKDDFYAYAQARGYVYKTDVSSEGHPYDYVEKDDVPDTDYVGINYTVGWCVMYARCDDADIMSKNNYTGTLEFLYIYLFG